MQTVGTVQIMARAPSPIDAYLCKSLLNSIVEKAFGSRTSIRFDPSYALGGVSKRAGPTGSDPRVFHEEPRGDQLAL